MRAFADQYKIHPQVRELALSLVRDLNQKDYTGEIQRLWSYVKNNVRYVRDIRGVETVQTPLKTLEYGQGDCDDKSTLLASMLESLGHTTRFKALGVNGSRLCHVLVEVNYRGQWLPLETTEPVGLGWYPPNVTTTLIEGEGLAGLFSGVTKAFKRVLAVGEKIERKTSVGRMVADKALSTEQGRQVVGLVGAVLTPFVPIVGVPLTLAAKAGDVHASELAAKKMKKAVEAKKKGDKKALAEMDKLRFVFDPAKNEIREATAADVGVPLYKYNPGTRQLTQVSEPVAGSSVVARETPQSRQVSPVVQSKSGQWVLPAGLVTAAMLLLR